MSLIPVCLVLGDIFWLWGAVSAPLDDTFNGLNLIDTPLTYLPAYCVIVVGLSKLCGGAAQSLPRRHLLIWLYLHLSPIFNLQTLKKLLWPQNFCQVEFIQYLLRCSHHCLQSLVSFALYFLWFRRITSLNHTRPKMQTLQKSSIIFSLHHMRGLSGWRFTSFQSHKWPPTKVHPIPTIFWHSFHALYLMMDLVQVLAPEPAFWWVGYFKQPIRNSYLYGS